MMTNRLRLTRKNAIPLQILGCTILALLLHTSIAVANDKPNIIVIFTDDQGYHDLGCFGSQTIKTPHLDQMAAEGLRLTSFYAQPVCGVSRAALMTGCYPIRVAEPDNVKHLHTVPHPQEWTMAEMLKEAGYATALIGKWHLCQRDRKASTGFRAATMPNAQGFDYFYGTPQFNGLTTFVNQSRFRSPILRNEEVVVPQVQDWDAITGDYTREAIDWIEKHHRQPFFLYLAHNMPHIPVGASKNFKNKSKNGPYGDTIEEIDWSCGQIFAKLKSLGLDENTLVVFTSDNGPWIEKQIPRNHSGTADPLRGWKMSAWDGGSRVPCIVRWPGKISPGRESDEVLTTMDLLPTFAAFAKAKTPKELILDGFDASEFLLGKTDNSPRDEYFYYCGCLLTGVRVGEWKLVLPREKNPPGTGWWGRMIEAVVKTQLFNLDKDPGESNDIARQHPDVVQRLMQRIQHARQELGDIDRSGRGARFFDEGPRRLEATRRSIKNRKVVYDNAKPVGNYRFTFEKEDWQGWKVVEGSLPDALTDRDTLPNFKSQPFNKQGDWFLFTGNRKTQTRGDDSQVGIIESPTFLLKGPKVSFLIGGGSGNSTYVALYDSDGKQLRKASGSNGPTMRRVVWNMSDSIGKRVKLRIVDQSAGGWGHVTFDDFSCQTDD
ncbi:sulfatase [Gimesia aquarii]|nr:sulfatase [Gimesia aquarii]